ncbi:hypothetical protein PAXRUDRAFT_822597 [Paxillus rubicundulus Ve08.2h10]|uniref:Uncharacterized protein n=1 Tax=Paxillus rubicundulus Ve08.2h10 TaxID=930991 RepID=A0A0D0DWC0_9AGAM|nr:hypothetical protein PAXRUDRAFT_822597 [Paxillus rubicundulus Ve08.2h10]
MGPDSDSRRQTPDNPRKQKFLERTNEPVERYHVTVRYEWKWEMTSSYNTMTRKGR